jgi:hypothetical protein
MRGPAESLPDAVTGQLSLIGLVPSHLLRPPGVRQRSEVRFPQPGERFLDHLPPCGRRVREPEISRSRMLIPPLAWAVRLPSETDIRVVIVALAVGIPYFMTHRRMREHHDVSDSRYYLRARRKSRLQRRDASESQR